MNPDLEEKKCDGDISINNQVKKDFILLNLQLIPAELLFTGVNWHNWVTSITDTVSKQLEADLNFNCASSSHGFLHGTSRMNLRASSFLSEIWDTIKSCLKLLFQACLSILVALWPSPVSPLCQGSKMLSSQKEKSWCRICYPPLILYAGQPSFFCLSVLFD